MPETLFAFLKKTFSPNFEGLVEVLKVSAVILADKDCKTSLKRNHFLLYVSNTKLTSYSIKSEMKQVL